MRRLAPIVAAFALSISLAGCSGPKGDSADERRVYVREAADDILTKIYEEEPQAKAQVEAAAGYGAFSSIGTNLILVSTEGGYGVVKNNKTGDETFMKMVGGGVGIGLGVKDYRMLMIFEDEATMNDFVENGWEAGADAEAAAVSGDTGGEASAGGNLEAGTRVYTITENGVALSATVGATKFYKDKELN